MNLRAWLEDERRLFWTLHLCGWAAWGFIGKYGYSRWVVEDAVPNYGFYVTVITIIAVVICLGLRLLFRACWDRPIWLQAVAFLGGSFAAGYLWMSARSFIYYRWIEQGKDMKEWAEKVGPHAVEIYEKISYLEGYFSGWSVMLAWSVLYYAIKYYRIFQEVRESALKSAAMAHEAQLKMLRYQLNPHVLFNTLNAISTLILDNENRTANQTVMRLSEFLRYTLDQDPMKKVTLRQEIEAMNLYLTTEKLRFGDRLKLEYAIEDTALEALVPSLLLQPLIENAVKFAVSPSEQGGTIRVEGRARGNMLELAVSDDGPGLPSKASGGAAPGAGRGVGLRNTRERLSVLYEDQHRFATLDNKPGLRIELGLPLEMASS